MSNALTVIEGDMHGAQKYEQAFIMGDLSALSDAERLHYYMTVCQSLGLNPATRPLEFLRLQGNKLTLYARKDCTDQLRSLRGVSIWKPELTFQDGLVIVTITAQDRTGRTDSDIGVVTIGNLQGDARANALMKCVTKGKRRVTLSICGLGILDESELETIPGAEAVPMDLATGAIALPALAPESSQETQTEAAAPPEQPQRTLKELSEAFKMRAGDFHFSSPRNSDYARLLSLLHGKEVKASRETVEEALNQIDLRWQKCVEKLKADLANENGGNAA